MNIFATSRFTSPCPVCGFGNLPEEKCGVLRLHHHELDEALCHLAGLGVGLDFGHGYSFFATTPIVTGLTVAMTQGCC